MIHFIIVSSNINDMLYFQCMLQWALTPFSNDILDNHSIYEDII